MIITATTFLLLFTQIHNYYYTLKFCMKASVLEISSELDSFRNIGLNSSLAGNA